MLAAPLANTRRAVAEGGEAIRGQAAIRFLESRFQVPESVITRPRSLLPEMTLLTPTPPMVLSSAAGHANASYCRGCHPGRVGADVAASIWLPVAWWGRIANRNSCGESGNDE